MLILNRRPGQSIVIDDDITVTVLSQNEKGEVRLGIDAPLSVPVHREEVFLRIKQQEEEAQEAFES